MKEKKSKNSINEWKECPFSTTQVKIKNLQSHFEKVHKEVSLFKRKFEIKKAKKEYKKNIMSDFERWEIQRKRNIVGILSIIVVLIISALLLMPSGFFNKNNANNNEEINEYNDKDNSEINNNEDNSNKNSVANKKKDFSLCELFVTTNCGACPSAEENLKSIYEEKKYNFHYVTMITDKNNDANDRANDYGIQYVPTAEFNGGSIEKVGSKSIEEYKNDIKTCLNEKGLNVSIEVSMVKVDEDTINVKVEEFSNQSFEGYLRVYVVEKESRYKNSEDEQIPYGFLGYAFDKEIKLYTNETKNEENEWNEDNIDYENLIVIGTIFDKEGYALASYITEA